MNKSKKQRIPRRKKKEMKRLNLQKQNKPANSVAVLFISPKKISFSKNEEQVVNEDAALAQENVLAISDGAGGGGVFAERWSQTLLENLSTNPITTWEELNNWMDGFADDFYAECEELAKEKGGLFLDKFYEEGSFATLAAVWRVSEWKVQWFAYGDSVIFCYDKNSDSLQHSITSLSEFDSPPYLLNTVTLPSEAGVCAGSFKIEKDSIVFVASDAVSHLLLMLYALEHQEEEKYKTMVEASLTAQTKTSNFVKQAIAKSITFKEVLNCLIKENQSEVKTFLYDLEQKGVLAHDDYSFSWAYC